MNEQTTTTRVFWAGPYIGWMANLWEVDVLITGGIGDSPDLALDDLNNRLRRLNRATQSDRAEQNKSH
jgi:hypothetical protein